MNALDSNRFTEAWQQFGASVPSPRAILVVSAHWYINATALTAMPSPRTIHDFYGFPQELFDVQYPAPGSPEIAEEIAELAKPAWIGLDRNTWGIDHGTWSVLVHAFPKADIPVLQLSINAAESYDYHLNLGRQLASLRDRGILIIGSGNVVHNLKRVDWHKEDAAFDWNVRFDDAVKEIMLSSPGDLPGVVQHPDYALAVPTEEHFIPLLYLAGLAEAEGKPTRLIAEGYSMGSLSMTAYGLGVGNDVAMADGAAAATGPDVPGVQSNM